MDALPAFEGTKSVFDNEKVLPLWREAWSLKEKAPRARATKTVESLNEHSKDLPPLRHGNKVFIQNQQSILENNPKKTGEEKIKDFKNMQDKRRIKDNLGKEPNTEKTIEELKPKEKKLKEDFGAFVHKDLWFSLLK